MSDANSTPESDGRLQALAEFRYVLRRFLHFSEEAAGHVGLTPQQHQLLLQVEGIRAGCHATIGYLSERLSLRHHSVVELSRRCEEAGLLTRRSEQPDRRLVVLELTVRGRSMLDQLSEAHARELHELGPELIEALRGFTL